MIKEILQAAYDSWTESESYVLESELERADLKEKTRHILEFARKGDTGCIEDCLAGFACGAEIAAFEQGFRRGILFMQEVKEGIACQ